MVEIKKDGEMFDYLILPPRGKVGKGVNINDFDFLLIPFMHNQE